MNTVANAIAPFWFVLLTAKQYELILTISIILQMVEAVGQLEQRMQKIMEADLHQKAAGVLSAIDYQQLLTGTPSVPTGDPPRESPTPPAPGPVENTGAAAAPRGGKRSRRRASSQDSSGKRQT